jgi:hypothetical protein
VILAPAVAASGARLNWLFVKVTMAVVGLASVVLIWRLVFRLTGDRRLGDLAALFVALNPYFWDFSHQAMSEVPAVGWAALALLVGDHVFARCRPGSTSALLAGVVCGSGMLVKGHLIGLVLLPLAYVVGPRAMAAGWSRRMLVTIMFAAGFGLPFGGWMIRNAAIQAPGWDGVNQVQQVFSKRGGTDQEMRSLPETVTHVIRTFRMHGVYRLAEQTIPFLALHGALAWPGSGWLALAVFVAIGLALLPRSLTREYLGFHIVITPIVVLNLLYADGGSARYWVPVSILVVVLLVLRLGGRLLGRSARATPRHVLVPVSVVLAVSLALYVVAHERSPYSPKGPWRELAEFFDLVAKERIRPVGVLTPNMHAFQLITGFPAPMLGTPHAPLFDYMVARQDGKGPPPPPYASVVVSRYPWAMYKLPFAVPETELVRGRDFSYGIAVDDY